MSAPGSHNINRAFRAMAGAARNGPAETLDSYVQHVQEIHSLTQKGNILTSDVYCDGIADYGNLIRFSCILHDLSFLCLRGEKRITSKVVLPEAFERTFGTNRLTFSFPRKELKRIGLDEIKDAAPCFLVRCDDETTEILQDLYPLIESGRLAVRPARGVLVPTGKVKDHRRRWQIWGVNEDGFLGRWEVPEDVSDPQSAPLHFGTESYTDQEEMFKICVPFIDGISMRDWNALISDEQDHIASVSYP